jgi:hypothetical protein
MAAAERARQRAAVGGAKYSPPTLKADRPHGHDQPYGASLAQQPRND